MINFQSRFFLPPFPLHLIVKRKSKIKMRVWEFSFLFSALLCSVPACVGSKNGSDELLFWHFIARGTRPCCSAVHCIALHVSVSYFAISLTKQQQHYKMLLPPSSPSSSSLIFRLARMQPGSARAHVSWPPVLHHIIHSTSSRRPFIFAIKTRSVSWLENFLSEQ